MRVLGLIPARGGSKRLPRKNLRLIGGQTLVSRAIQVATQAKSLTRVIVSSDDDEISSEASRYGETMRRPADLASDTSPIIDTLRYTLEALELAGDPRYDAAVVLHPTCPLRLPEDIESTLALMMSSGARSAVSVVQVNHMIHPLKLKVMNGDRLNPFLEPERGRRMAHQLPPIFVRNCAVYAATRELIDDGLLIDEEDCVGFVMPSERSVDINDAVDLELAEILLRKRSERT